MFRCFHSLWVSPQNSRGIPFKLHRLHQRCSMDLQGDIETSPVFKMYNFGLRCAYSMNSSSIWFMVYPWRAMIFFWSKSGPTTESSGINLKKLVNDISGQIIIFHQPRFPWNDGNSCPQLPFRGKSVVWGRYNLTRHMTYSRQKEIILL